MIYRSVLQKAFRRCAKTAVHKPHLSSMAPLSSAVPPPPTKGEMLSRQKELPPLPLPPLKETVDKYLHSVQPYLTPDELNVTKKLADEFVAPGGVGETLHKLLAKRAAKEDNWLSGWWLKGAYLGYRNPVVVYSSPAMVMPRQEFRSPKDQLAYTASLIQAVLDFKAHIDNETMSTEVQGTAPLDMMQYKNIFASCREPHLPLDKLHLAKDSRHIVIAHQGNFYEVTVYSNGEQLKTEQILAQLQQIIEDSHRRGKGHQVGILTTWHRDLWANSFARLFENPTNRASLATLRDAIALVCLDDPLKDVHLPWESVAAHQLLDGGIDGVNAGNRWCDKTIQLIVGVEGNVGILYEHSPAEGPPVANLVDFCVKQASIWPLPAKDSPCKPKHLEFIINKTIEDDIEKARSDLKTLTNDLELNLYSYEKYGKDFVKSCNLSPDSFIQMAIQLAFYRAHQKPGACYETATLRRFLGGRTETIRSCSQESSDFCSKFLDLETNAKVKAESLRKAVTAHKAYTNMAIRGQGVDRLFFGMKMMAAEANIQIPSFFFDKAMVVSTHFRLSTSQVPAKSRSVMFYGPLVPDGYGCCYNPMNNRILFGLSAFKSCATTDLSRFRDCLEYSLNVMGDYLRAESITSKL
ncbi:carnitine O-acetyltransferase-like isoform X1 [Varroa jacobsoni]|uniref:carnitine O-acetyltransferase-like isoform X1 n=2 Tax=Varroa jacobsoni TaxID=62625 RepID=UPI000BF7B234|nr:carnitine O-acetyltransferase-like isoform X1 [Varroa jacobsoni]